MRIFKITTHSTKYLQTSGMDFHKSQRIVNGPLKQFKLISRDGQEFKTIARQFIANANIKLEAWEDTENKNYDLLIETSLQKLRVRMKKQHFDKLIDDDPIYDSYLNFKVKVYARNFCSTKY